MGVPHVEGLGALFWISSGIAARWKNPIIISMNRLFSSKRQEEGRKMDGGKREGTRTNSDPFVQPHHGKDPALENVELRAV